MRFNFTQLTKNVADPPARNKGKDKKEETKQSEKVMTGVAHVN